MERANLSDCLPADLEVYLQRFYWFFLLDGNFPAWKAASLHTKLKATLSESHFWQRDLIHHLCSDVSRFTRHRKTAQSAQLKPWSDFLHSARQEDILVLIWYFMFSFDEATISSGLQISRSAVKYRLTRGLLRWSNEN